MAVTQLAIAYCDSAFEDISIRATWFPSVDFNKTADIAFDTAGRANLLNPLLEQLMPSTLITQPDKAAVYAELDNLITRLGSCGSNCGLERTNTIAKSTCAAVLASAVMLVQ